MKRYITSLFATLVLLFGLSAQVSASTNPYWIANISTLPTYMTTQKFNVQYDVTSTQPDSFTAELYVSTDGGATYPSVPCNTQDTNSDANDVYGGSGTLPACISTDGAYTFKVVVTRDGSSDPAQTFTTNTQVDSMAPNAPSYAGKTISGDTYTLSFSAPSNSDVNSVSIYASTSKTFTADSSTLVGSVNVAANQTYTFSYTAPNSTIRYFALQSYDKAGNGSTLVGDPGVIVTPVITTSSVQNGPVSNDNTSSGQVLGSTTTANGSGTSTGQINAIGQSSKQNPKSNKGKVLGTSATKNKLSSSAKVWETTGAVLVALIVIYLNYIVRTNRSVLFKKRSK